MDELEKNLGYLLNKAARLAKWELNNRLNELGITSAQWVVLKDLSVQEQIPQNHQNLTPASIAERIHSDRPTVTGIIQRLTKHGWVIRATNPEDRRSQIIQLTDKAWEIIPILSDMSNHTMEQATRGFAEEEIQELKNYLIKIIRNFS